MCWGSTHGIGKKIAAFVPNDSCLNFIEENGVSFDCGFERKGTYCRFYNDSVNLTIPVVVSGVYNEASSPSECSLLVSERSTSLVLPYQKESSYRRKESSNLCCFKSLALEKVTALIILLTMDRALDLFSQLPELPSPVFTAGHPPPDL
ncbi:hypothetical protein RJ641_028227, partial [Dillenia turbinata]